MKKKKSPLLLSFAAVATALSLLVSNVFSSPAELLGQRPEQAIVAEASDFSDSDDSADEEGEGERKRPIERLRQRLLKLPYLLRLFLGVPLWVAGCGLQALGELAFRLLSPVLGFLARWLLTALLLAGAVALIAKLLFPHLRLRDIFTKSRLLTLLFGSLSINLWEKWAEYTDHSKLFCLGIRYGGSLILLLVLTIPLVIAEQWARENAEQSSE